jgi:TPR repeat protein
VGFRPVLARPAPTPKAPTSLSTAHPAVLQHPITVKIPAATVPEDTLTSDQKKIVQKAIELEKAATASKEKGEYSESVTQYRQALRVWEEVGPLSIPPAIATRLHLSQCLVAQKQWEGAIVELQLALALQDADVSEGDRMTKRMPLILLQRVGQTDLFDSDLTLTNCHLLATTLAEVAKVQTNATDKATFLHEAQIFADRVLFGRKNRLQPDADKLIEARQLVVALAVALQELPFESRKTYPPREINPPDIAPLTDAARARVKSASRAALAEADQQWQQALEMRDDDGFTESKPLFAAATAAYQRILGAEHPHTLRCRGVNAWVQHSFFEKEKEKVTELRTIIAAQQRVLPKDDPITLWCLDKLLYLIRNDYRSEEALKLARDLVAAHTRISGPDHHRTLEAREDLARLLVSGTLDAQAEKEYTELTALYTRKHGVDMEQAMQCRSALGGQLVDHGQPAAALTRLLTWLVIRDTRGSEISDKKPILDLAYALTLLNRPSEALVFARRAATPPKEDSLYGRDHDKPFGCEALVKALETRVQKIRDGQGDSADKSIHETEGPAERPASNAATNEDAVTPGSSGKLTSRDKIEKIGLTSVMMRALRGDPECQYLNFVIYKSGGPVEKNPLAAFHWALLAAEAGHLEAHNEVAVFYNKGEDVVQNYPEAIRWLRKAAESGNANAMYNMGMSYTLGQGVEKDAGQMVYWYEKSALAGHLGAQRFLGSILQLGSDGVGQDLEAACRWFAMGAAQDDAKCLYFLGINCYRGEGVPMDKPVAIGMWRRAAEQGDKEAQFKLGCCYSLGDEGLVKDPQSAYIWLKLAAGQGHKQAAEFASDIVSRDLSKKEIADAVVQIKRFEPRAPRSMPVSIAAATEKPDAPTEDEDIGIGTGFFISRSGHLVTNYHVIKDAIGIRVLLGHDKEVPATVIAQDKKADLAILKVSVPDSTKAGDRYYLPIAPAGGVKLGSTVATVGFPNISVQGFSPKLSKGEISSLAGIQDDPGEFQISVPLQPGNSGGALVDAKGNVVGVVCSILDQRIALATTGTLANNVAYAVKSSLLLNLIESVPNLSDELAEPTREVRTFEDVVEDVQHATAMVLVKVKTETKTNSTSKSKSKVKN